MMKNKKLHTLLLLITALLISNLSFSESYREGEDYDVLEKPGTVEVPGKIEVREFFWFGCPHCFALEEYIEPWAQKLPKDVNFVSTPTPMSEKWVNHAHAFYVADAVGKLNTIKPALFKAIHVDNQPLRSKDELADFFAKYDVPKENFDKLFDSFSVRVKVRQAGALTKAYKLRSVPVVVVNGKYVVASKSGRGPDGVLKVVDFLIEKERVAGELSQASSQH